MGHSERKKPIYPQKSQVSGDGGTKEVTMKNGVVLRIGRFVER